MVKLTLKKWQEHLESSNAQEEKKHRKKLIQRIEEDNLFHILTLEYCDNFKKRIIVDGDTGEAITSGQYEDKSLRRIFRKVKTSINQRGKKPIQYLGHSTVVSLVEIKKALQALENALNTDNPQSDPSKLDAYPIKFLENGQGYFNFFPEEEVKEETPPFSSHLGAVDMQSKDENSGDDDDNDDDDGYEYDRQRIHNK